MKTQEVAVQAVLNIRLNSDTQNIDEVVVTAIGIKRSEKSLGYAVSSVGGEEITKARESNVVNALSGKVAGVRIGQSSGTAGGAAKIQIRGASSIGTNSSPLFVVDGLPIDNVASTELFKGYASPVDEFKNRDNRMENTFMVYGEKYWDNKTAPRNSWDDNDLAKCIIANNNWICKGSGYQNHKWAVERSVSDYYETMDYPVIRYAEVLLNYAEAVYELGITGTDLDEALNNSLNLVRWRSNPDMPGLSTNLVATNGLSMREEIRRERAIELILEGFRIDDLKRWYVASTEMPQVQLGVKYIDTWFETNWSKITNTLSEGCLVLYSGRTWQDKNYLYPLPSDQLQLNPQLEQNPGWGN